MATSATTGTGTEKTNPVVFNAASGAVQPEKSTDPQKKQDINLTGTFKSQSGTDTAAEVSKVLNTLEKDSKTKKEEEELGLLTVYDRNTHVGPAQISFGDAIARFVSLLMKLFSGKWEEFDVDFNGPGGFKDTYIDPVEENRVALEKNTTPKEREQIKDMGRTIERALLTLSPNMNRIERLQAMAQDPNIQKLMNFIKKLESKGGKYDIVNGGSEPLINGKPLSESTLEEVLTAQLKGKGQWKNAASTAAGAYQVMPGTLEASAKRLGLDIKTTIYSKEIQELIGMDLLENRGLSAHMSGEKDRANFMKEIASEWASLPMDESGKARWGHLANNPKFVPQNVTRELIQILDSLPTMTRS